MSVSDLSTSTQNYLKAIWGLKEWSSEPVTATLIAKQLGLKLSSVSDAVRKMAKQGLVSHTPYGSVELTELGRQYALVMVRRHRLLESFWFKHWATPGTKSIMKPKISNTRCLTCS